MASKLMFFSQLQMGKRKSWKANVEIINCCDPGGSFDMASASSVNVSLSFLQELRVLAV